MVSENSCPVGERNLEQWVRKGLGYGRKIKADAPERLSEVFVEMGENKLAALREVIDAVVAKAKGTEPVPLAAAIVEHVMKAHEWSGPRYYGGLMDVVAYCADFAIWIPWASKRID
jgi:hypothetical protein